MQRMGYLSSAKGDEKMEIYKLARSVYDVKEYLKGAKVISFDFERSRSFFVVYTT